MASSRPNPDWQCDKTVVECNDFLLNNPLMADVFFLVGDEQRRIPAHKYVLASRSSVFYAMLLHGGLAADDEKDIKVPDVTPAGFLNTLEFLYTEKTSLQEDTVLDTIYAGKKYVVPALVRHCNEYLKTVLKPDIACLLLLEEGRLIDDEEVIKICWDVIDQRTEEVFQSKSFLEISPNLLLSILERETLSCREVVLFRAALAWANAECVRKGELALPQDLRKVLGPALFAVRFPTMTQDEFAKHVASSGVLDVVEVRDIFIKSSVEKKPLLMFPVKPRMRQTPDLSLSHALLAKEITLETFSAMANSSLQKRRGEPQKKQPGAFINKIFQIVQQGKTEGMGERQDPR